MNTQESKQATPVWIAAIVAAGMLVVGSFGPWAKTLGGLVSVSGMDGGDGVITLIIGGVAIALLIREWNRGMSSRIPSFILILLGVIGFAVFLIDGSDVIGDQSGEAGELFGDDDPYSAGWGLWMIGLGSLALSVSGAIRAIKFERPPTVEAEAAPSEVAPASD